MRKVCCKQQPPTLSLSPVMAILLRRLQETDSHEKHCFSCFSQISTFENFLLPNDLHAPFPESQHRVVGYCKGLFCLEYEDGRIVVWNPSTNEFKLIPPSHIQLPPCLYPNCNSTNCKAHVISRVRALGFDPESGDYKVLRFVTVFYANNDINSPDLNHGTSKRVEMYSLKDDCWKEITSPAVKKMIEGHDIIDEYGIYVNGFCYWKAVTIERFEDVVIVSFDLAEEKFSTLCFPGVPHTDSILIEFKGSLGMVVYSVMDVYKSLRPFICVIKKNEPQRWKKKGFKVKVEAERPLGYCRNDELLLLEGYDRKLLVYDSVAREMKKMDEIYDHPHTMQLFPFVESTVSLSRFDTNTEDATCDTKQKREKGMLKLRKCDTKQKREKGMLKLRKCDTKQKREKGMLKLRKRDRE